MTNEKIEKIEKVYSQAVGSWNGCNWTHILEDSRDNAIDLDGVSSVEATENYQEIEDSNLSALWEDAADWLSGVEQDARLAEEEAEEAMDLVRAGDLKDALKCAQKAQSIESEYGDSPVWGPLVDAIEEAIEYFGSDQIFVAEMFGDAYKIKANWAEASSPIMVDHLDGWESTPFQVASFSHCHDDAMRHFLEEAIIASGDKVEDYAAEIDKALEGAYWE